MKQKNWQKMERNKSRRRIKGTDVAERGGV